MNISRLISFEEEFRCGYKVSRRISVPTGSVDFADKMMG